MLTGRRLLRELLRAVRGPLAVALGAGLVWQAVAVAVPYVAGRAIDDGVLADDLGALLGWAGVLLALGLVRWAGDRQRHWWVDRSGMRAAVWVRERLLERVASLDGDAASRLGAGDLIARVTSDVRVLDNWVRGLATLLTAAFTLVAVGGGLLGLGLVLALVGLATVPLTVLLALSRVAAQHRAAAVMAEAGGRHSAAMEEVVAGIRTVKGIGGEAVVARRAGAVSAELAGAARGRERVESSWLSGAMFVPAAGIAAGVWLGGEQVLDGTLSAGALLTFVGWMALLVDAVQTLTERMIDRGEARAAADRLVGVLCAPALAVPAAPAALPAGRTVDLDGVSVVREGREVLSGVDVHVPAGQWVAVLGPSGSGKSTLLRLVPRLADPTAGRVRVAGMDVARVRPDVLRGRVAYLGQDAVLLSGTVAENLRLAAPAAGDDELWAALEAAGALDVVARLDGGLDGRIGTGGMTLSGGQRQRLVLARTLLARPEVLVLDDVTSALDAPTEAAVLEGVRAALPRATILAATHRLAVVRAADRAVVLGHGRVVQDGAPAEVLAAPSSTGTADGCTPWRRASPRWPSRSSSSSAPACCWPLERASGSCSTCASASPPRCSSGRWRSSTPTGPARCSPAGPPTSPRCRASSAAGCASSWTACCSSASPSSCCWARRRRSRCCRCSPWRPPRWPCAAFTATRPSPTPATPRPRPTSPPPPPSSSPPARPCRPPAASRSRWTAPRVPTRSCSTPTTGRCAPTTACRSSGSGSSPPWRPLSPPAACSPAPAASRWGSS